MVGGIGVFSICVPCDVGLVCVMVFLLLFSTIQEQLVAIQEQLVDIQGKLDTARELEGKWHTTAHNTAILAEECHV
jgi:hypothetical protein